MPDRHNADSVELAGASFPTTFQGNAILPLEGASLVPAFLTGQRTEPEGFFWEHMNNAAVRHGNGRHSAI